MTIEGNIFTFGFFGADGEYTKVARFQAPAIGFADQRYSAGINLADKY